MKKKTPVIVSACLCGVPCRYDGKSGRVEELAQLYEQGLALLVCPEVDGGLDTPRPPCEIVNGRVLDREGGDVTENFLLGARKALELAQSRGVRLAVLKEKSPSCGSSLVYDGSFSGRLVPGQGVTAALLASVGIRVCNETNFHDFI